MCISHWLTLNCHGKNLKLNRFTTELTIILYSLSLEMALLSIQSQRVETSLTTTDNLLYNRNSFPSILRMLGFFSFNVSAPPFFGYWPREVDNPLPFLSYTVSSETKVYMQVVYFGTCSQAVVSWTRLLVAPKGQLCISLSNCRFGDVILVV